MPRKAIEPQPPNTCTSCGGPVAARRPSRTGAHFCSKVLCQNAKVAFYRKAKVAAAGETTAAVKRELEEVIDNHATFIVAIMSGQRVQCPTCGLTDAIVGFPHPNREGAACRALGYRALRPAAVFAVWPPESRVFADGD